jgi:hypothetical protein
MAAFARSGNPGTKALPWPGYSLEKRSTMIFDAQQCAALNDPDRESCFAIARRAVFSEGTRNWESRKRAPLLQPSLYRLRQPAHMPLQRSTAHSRKSGSSNNPSSYSANQAIAGQPIGQHSWRLAKLDE